MFPEFRKRGSFGLIVSETVTLFRFRPPGQVHNHQPGLNEQSVCSARAKVYRSFLRAGEIFGLETIGTIGTDGTIGTGSS
jgi:hypothetical protein